MYKRQGLAFDSFGRLWIQTDGSYSNAGDFVNMGNNQMLAADPGTKEIRRFLVGPSGCEITGVTWTPDRKTMFINVQHPGEVSGHPRANNVWGHIVRWTEASNDPTALTFNWDIFVLAGQPSITDARKPSANITIDNLFNSPDGLAFDSFGRLWIQTDGSYSNAGDFVNMLSLIHI